MALANHAFEVPCAPSAATPLVLFERQAAFDAQDVRALLFDFFSWFEDEWKQPVIQTSWPDRDELLRQIPFAPPLEEEKTYTFAHLATVAGRNKDRIRMSFKQLGIRAVGRLTRKGRGGGTANLYLGRDCLDVVEMWKRDNLCAAIDSLWARFLPTPCGRCPRCLTRARSSVFECFNIQAYEIRLHRASFNRFLQAVRRYEDIASWWKHEQDAIVACSPGSITQHTGIVLLYLLDRHLLDLSLDDLLRLRFPGMQYADLLRPWSNRCPEEYKFYLRGVEIASDDEDGQRKIHAILTLIFMKYGLRAVAELGRRLSSEEIRRAVREGCLLTPYLCYDIYLDSPMSDDIRVGHIALDEMRNYFWSTARNKIQALPPVDWFEGPRVRWEEGPRGWRTSSIQALERVLTAEVWHDGQALLPLRPETEKALQNPYQLRQRSAADGTALHLLPTTFQDIIPAYISYRYQEQHITLPTISNIIKVVISFLCWAQTNSDLNSYTLWDRTKVPEIVRDFLSATQSHIKTNRRNRVIQILYHFFYTLGRIDLPHPPRYPAILTLLHPLSQTQRPIPPEEVLDRVFHDGVCQLDHDPFARLALTIQYFCGTRVTETCELPLFCLFELGEDDGSRFLYLVIPRGKTDEERSFPIAKIGMGPLLEYMEQVVRMQLAPGEDEKPLHASRMNVRYLETDPEKAFHWDYLFDRRLHRSVRRSAHPGVLSGNRVGEALREAMLFAAKKNPTGLFREETYSRRCRRKRRPGQFCNYLSLEDGITICPICGGSLPGQRGHLCQRHLKKGFECDGEGDEGDYFCPRCNGPLAELISITSHTFRHNSVTRAHRYGIPLAQNMHLHGHNTNLRSK